MNLAQAEDISRRLSGHNVVEAVEGEHDGFSDVGKSWEKGSSAMSGGTNVQITQCPFLQQTSMQWATRACLACWPQDRCTPVSCDRYANLCGKRHLGVWASEGVATPELVPCQAAQLAEQGSLLGPRSFLSCTALSQHQSC